MPDLKIRPTTLFPDLTSPLKHKKKQESQKNDPKEAEILKQKYH